MKYLSQIKKLPVFKKREIFSSESNRFADNEK